MNLLQELAAAKKHQMLLQNTAQELIDACLTQLAEELVKQQENILTANQKDLETIKKEDPMYDRILLTPERITGISDSLKTLKALKSLVGEVLEEKKLPNKLWLQKVCVPLGVVGVIYEARPNVTIDVFALCFKTKNIAILKCGSEAQHSSQALVKIIHEVLKKNGLPENLCVLLPSDRALTLELLQAREFLDVLIPRGGAGLINWVRENAKVPIIETGAGVVHIFVDENADEKMASQIIFNAKTRRPSVCNSLDTLIVHRGQLNALPELTKKLAGSKVVIYADDSAYKALEKIYPHDLLHKAGLADFGREFLSLAMAIKTVASLEEAVEHITKFGSKHSESIVTENKGHAEYFLKIVDAAAVYHNVSTAFTDGGEFGMGAEIGISTQKLHARGPMALKELTTYKWLIRGNGQTR